MIKMLLGDTLPEVRARLKTTNHGLLIRAALPIAVLASMVMANNF